MRPPALDDAPSAGTLPASHVRVSFLRVYLIGYFLLAFAAFWTLWQSGILTRVPGIWIALAALAVVVLGVVLAIVSPTRSAAARG